MSGNRRLPRNVSVPVDYSESPENLYDAPKMVQRHKKYELEQEKQKVWTPNNRGTTPRSGKKKPGPKSRTESASTDIDVKTVDVQNVTPTKRSAIQRSNRSRSNTLERDEEDTVSLATPKKRKMEERMSTTSKSQRSRSNTLETDERPSSSAATPKSSSSKKNVPTTPLDGPVTRSKSRTPDKSPPASSAVTPKKSSTKKNVPATPEDMRVTRPKSRTPESDESVGSSKVKLEKATKSLVPINKSAQSNRRMSRRIEKNKPASERQRIEGKSVLQEEYDQELEAIEPEEFERPTELNPEDGICGQDMFKMYNPGKNRMLERAKASTVATPSPKAKKGQRVSSDCRVQLQKMSLDDKKNVQETGRGTRSKKSIIYKNSDSESDESGTDGEEYVASEVESESEDEEVEVDVSDKENASNSEDENAAAATNEASSLSVTFSTMTLRSRITDKAIENSKNRAKVHGKIKKSVTYSECRLNTENYFESQSSKAITSNHTLAKLRNPKLKEAKVQELLADLDNDTESEHAKNVIECFTQHRSSFSEWYNIMTNGFSLLLHGLGSKQALINCFYEDMLNSQNAVIVNGFFPSLTIKEILDGITEALEIENPGPHNACVNAIRVTMEKRPDERFFLLINNIDGPMLRPKKVQEILSRLASTPNICLLASVDHINSPLLWDNRMKHKFKFYWIDATTFLPYTQETSYEGSLMVQQSGALALSSLTNVFLSLPSNARKIYTILINYQLENSSIHNYPGMAFSDLYKKSREEFLVASDLALKAQLREYLDHKLVRSKRNYDGGEYLVIPLDNVLLKQFLEQQEES